MNPSGTQPASREAPSPLPKKKGLAALLMAVFIWGSTFVATKDALQAFPPSTLAALRFALAVAVLGPFLPRRRTRSVRLPVSLAVLMGFSGVFLYFALQNWALLYCRASTASLVLASIPAFTALASRLFLNERISPARVAGIFLSMAGAAVLVWSENSLLAEETFNPGGLLLLGAALAWTAYTLLGRKLSQNDPVVLTFQTALWGLLFLLPFALAEGQPPYRSLGAEAWLVLLYLGIIASALPILLWNYALKTFEASEAGLYLNLIPVVAIALAFLLLGERVEWREMAAGLLILTGVVLADRGLAVRTRTRGR